jgi:hypothetical protein
MLLSSFAVVCLPLTVVLDIRRLVIFWTKPSESVHEHAFLPRPRENGATANAGYLCSMACGGTRSPLHTHLNKIHFILNRGAPTVMPGPRMNTWVFLPAWILKAGLW